MTDAISDAGSPAEGGLLSHLVILQRHTARSRMPTKALHNFPASILPAERDSLSTNFSRTAIFPAPRKLPG